MPVLTIYQNDNTIRIPFDGMPLLGDLLREHGFSIAQPCGGRGICEKCAVRVAGNIKSIDKATLQNGKILACQTLLLGDCEVFLEEQAEQYEGMQIQTDSIQNKSIKRIEPFLPEKYGIAVDIGTTTVALRLYSLNSGKQLSEASEVNPQVQVSADVIGRINAALNGKAGWLQSAIEECIHRLTQLSCIQAGIDYKLVEETVITGNTTMLYLLTGQNTEPLSHAPFQAKERYGSILSVMGLKTYLPPCMDAFVGADISCAVLASGMCKSNETALLIDIGTNGEIALWHNGKLFVTSTAAGPAFEGVGISCGCGSVQGAVDRVWIENGKLTIHTIGGKVPVGLCGSGLIDTVASLLKTGWIDETGASENEAFSLSENVSLSAQDIRNVQLAKGAIAAGVYTVLQSAGVEPGRVARLYIAGGFGSHIDIENAVFIGLIPKELSAKFIILGNAALAGAAELLLNPGKKEDVNRILMLSQPVHLGGNPVFTNYYMDCMLFGDE